MVVLFGKGVEQVDEHNLISDEAAGDERIWRPIQAHGPIVKLQERVEINLLSFDNLLSSRVSSETSEFKHTIVVEWESKLSRIVVLRKLVDFDVFSQDLL